MAIFHFALQNISANKGKSSIAAASYRSGQELYSEKQGVLYYYEKNTDAISFILKPEHAPEWCLDRQQLWNEVEKIEKAKNSRYAKEINIALPIELSDTQQKQLVREYCQKTFVDAGMVADIAIHRRDKNNPHFHVMLTNRPFNLDGTWGKKQEIEYILDKDGNKTYTKNGNVKKISIPTTDWDMEDTLIRWRREWAAQTNIVLEREGFTERISAESYETDGINIAPTIHEGLGADSKNNKEYNAGVKQQRKAHDDLSDTAERMETFERFDLLTKNLTPMERERITELSGSMKTLINFQNIEDKKRMLNNWRTSTYVKRTLGVDVARTLQTVGEQELAVHAADKLILDMSKRLVSKEYPDINQEQLTDYEIKWLADKTIRVGLLTQEQAEVELAELRPHLLEKEILLVTKQPITGWMNAEKGRQLAESRILATLYKYGRDLNTYTNTEGKPLDEFYSKEDYTKLGYLFKDITRADALKKVIAAHYDELLSSAFPEADLSKLRIGEKEKIYDMVMYHNAENKPMSLEELYNLAAEGKFTAAEREQGLRYISTGDMSEISDNKELCRVLLSENTRNVFLGECMDDETIDPRLLEAAVTKTGAEQEEKENYIRSEDESLVYKPRPPVALYTYFLALFDVCNALFADPDKEVNRLRAKNNRFARLERERKKEELTERKGLSL